MHSPAATDDDATLVASCRAGDGRAWALLVQRYQRLVHTVVGRAGLDEHTAADVFQTVFTRLLEHLPTLEQPERLQAWIVTTAKREALRLREKLRRQVSLTSTACDDGAGDNALSPEHDLPDPAPLAEDALDELQQLQLLREGLVRLDERCRRLLELLFCDEEDRLPYDQLAALLAMPQGSIGPTRSRCLGKLRRLVEPGEGVA